MLFFSVTSDAYSSRDTRKPYLATCDKMSHIRD